MGLESKKNMKPPASSHWSLGWKLLFSLCRGHGQCTQPLVHTQHQGQSNVVQRDPAMQHAGAQGTCCRLLGRRWIAGSATHILGVALLTWCHQQTPKWWMNQLKKVEGNWKISSKSRHQFDLRVGWSCCPPLSAAVPGNLLGQSHPHDCRSAAHLAVKGMLETPRATSTVHWMWEPNPWSLALQKWSNTYQSTLKALQFVQDWFCWLVDIKPANVNPRLWLLNQGGSFSNSDTSVHYTHAHTDTDTHTHIICIYIYIVHIYPYFG